MKKKIISALLVLVMIVGVLGALASCGDECTSHVDSNKDGKCDNCGAAVQSQECTEHVDKNKDGKCDVCKAKVKNDGGNDECTEHVDDDEDGKCDECGEKLDVAYEYYWDNVSFIFQMTNNTCADELSSGCERYLAGEYTVAFSVSCVRVILSGILFFGGAVHIAYGLCGAALSILTMLLTKRIGIFSVTGVSVSGALAHNAGQIICAVLLTQTPQLVFYLPVLLIGGSVSGALIGILSAIIQKKLTAAGF